MPPVAPTPEQEAEFARWRDEIDALDQQLVLAMNERAKVVQQVGEPSVGSATPSLRPREREVLEKIKGNQSRPLASRTLHAIWRQMMVDRLPSNVVFALPISVLRLVQSLGCHPAIW